MFSSWSPMLKSLKESAADLGAKYAETTNRAVAKGLDYTVVATKSALVATGVVDASVAAVALADRAVEASGVVGLTRKAVAATGRALDATAAAAERVGAGDISARMTSVSATALGPVAAMSSRALGASVDATVTAVDMTVNGTLKAVALTNRAAEALPQAADLFGIKEDLKELTYESNERMLAALYPNWNGDNSGCSALLSGLEASWSAVGTRLAAQQEAALYADALAQRAAAAALARRDAWRPLILELRALPDLAASLHDVAAGVEHCLTHAEAISALLDAAEAAAASAQLTVRSEAAARAAAAADARHASGMVALQQQQQLLAAHAAAEAQQQQLAAIAPGVLPRRLRVGPAVDARGLADVAPDFSEATASLRRFLDGGGGGGGAEGEATYATGGDGDARRARRKHKERGPDGERRRRRHREGREKGMEYLDYKGYQDPVSLVVQGEEPEAAGEDAAAAAAVHAAAAHRHPRVPKLDAAPAGAEGSSGNDSASEDAGSDY